MRCRAHRPHGRRRGAAAGRWDLRRQRWKPRRPPVDVIEPGGPAHAPRADRRVQRRWALPWRPINRVLSGIAPSGNFTLGNYLGALRHWVSFQDGNDAFYCVVDLHALTEPIDPA